MAWIIPLPIFTNMWLNLLVIGFLIFIFFRRSTMRKVGRMMGRGRMEAPAHSAPALLLKSESPLTRDFRTLDLKPGANFEEVKNAYRELAKIWHPDRFGDDAKLRERANAKLGEINGAYERLCKHFGK